MVKRKCAVWLGLIGSILGPHVLAMDAEAVNNADAQNPPVELAAVVDDKPVVKNDEVKKDVAALNDVTKEIAAEIKTDEPAATKREENEDLLEGFTKPFKSAHALAKEDTSLPTIGHLVLKNHTDTWESLVSYGFRKNGFTSADLQWVINEFSRPYYLTKEKAKNLFKIVFDMNSAEAKKDHRRSALVELLTKVDIRKQAYFESLKVYMGADSHSEDQNLLVATIESGYLDAFSSLLESFPELVKKIVTEPAVTRNEYKGKKESKYEYELKKYTLVEFLMRRQNSYLIANQYYIDAGRAIIKNAVRVVDDIRVLEITDPVYDLERVLFKHGHIDEVLDREVAKYYEGSTTTTSETKTK